MRNAVRYAIGILFLIGAIIVIVVLFNIVRNIFNGGSSQEEQTKKNQRYDLIGTANSGQPVRYTIRGPVRGNEEHQSVRITIDQSVRRYELLQGYNDEVIQTQETPNTNEAYKAFVAAINGAGFVSNVPAAGRGDEAQSCPLGQKYNFEVAPSTENSFYTWSTTCSREQGTFKGNQKNIDTLFKRQIPEYQTLTSQVKLS